MREKANFNKTIVLAILNFKGGVGKTTTSFNLLGELAQRGYKVLGIDFDPQANLSGLFNSKGIGMADDLSAQLLKSETEEDVEKILNNTVETSFGIDILPTSKDHTLATTINFIKAEEKLNADVRLRKALKKISKMNEYDFIVLDCSPGDNLLNKNVLLASDYIISPMEFDTFSPEGIEEIQKKIFTINDDYERNIKMLGILGTKYDGKTLAHRNIEEDIEAVSSSDTSGESLGSLMFKTKIRQRTAIAQSLQMGEPITIYDENSDGGKDYRNFTDEVLNRLTNKER